MTFSLWGAGLRKRAVRIPAGFAVFPKRGAAVRRGPCAGRGLISDRALYAARTAVFLRVRGLSAAGETENYFHAEPVLCLTLLCRAS